jgi:hypothetical protein
MPIYMDDLFYEMPCHFFIFSFDTQCIFAKYHGRQMKRYIFNDVLCLVTPS